MTTCKVCKTDFVKTRPLQRVCGLECAKVAGHAKAKVIKAKVERLDRAETRVKLESMAKKPELVAKAQKAFNDYVRTRDYGQPCISCDRPIAWGTTNTTGGVCDAGHWLSIGARVNLRFNEDNCWAQCKHCNDRLAGNAVNYRIGLIKRIGLERVEALECDHELKHYSKDQLREIAVTYRAKTKELQK